MTTRLDQLMEQRREKLGRIRAEGINPYPARYQRTHTSERAAALLKEAEITGKSEPVIVNVAGRITARRDMGKITFMDLRDGAGKIQLSFRKDRLDEAIQKLLKDLDIGDIIGVKGSLFRTRTNEPTINVEGLTILNKSLQPLPEKWHGLVDIDTRFRQRYLDLISNPEVKQVFKTRSKIITGIRRFLDSRGFLEVETPVLQASAGGALARPFVTHHNALDQDFYLRIALELHLKRLLVGGFDKVYELGRVFRNEGIDAMHNPEFTMLETYEAYADYNSVMDMLEEMLTEVCREVLGTEEAKFGEHTVSFKRPWRRLSLREAVKEFSGIDFMDYPTVESLRTRMQEEGIEVDPKKDWGRLVDDLISTFVQPGLVNPTFLIDYPVAMSPLAKAKPDDSRFVERFEMFAAGMEVANSFSELNDPDEQRARFIEQMKIRRGEDEENWTIDEDFLTALEFGMPPTGGLGVGIDRLVMLLTNQSSIREVILFPQLKKM